MKKHTRNQPLKDDPLKIVQVSDCHLFSSIEGKLLGLNTEQSLQLVLDLVRKEQQDADLILATGDISQDGSLDSYLRFQEHIATFNKPVYWLPGNHDELLKMKAVIPEPDRLSPCVIEQGRWRIFMLNTSVEGKVPGLLAQDQLDFLARHLDGVKDYHVMLVLHHHPISLKTRWLDAVGLKNPEDLFAITDRYTHIRAIVWGHVHQAYEGERNQVRLFSAPSTCVQFKPGSSEFAVDDQSPGYRWFHLYEDGHIETQVSRVVGVSFEVDYTVKGY